MSEAAVELDKVQAAQIALSANSMLETLTFLKGDLTQQDESFEKVAEAYEGMKAEYTTIFNLLLAEAKSGSLSGKSIEAFANAKFPIALATIDEQISGLLPDLADTRAIASYDFTRSFAMNELANKKKGVAGLWLIGEYHVQEIEEHLGGKVKYDLVSMNKFNADIKKFDAETGGSTIEINFLGELLTLSRKLAANLDYFKSGMDKAQSANDRLAHWDRCMGVMSALKVLIRAGLADAEIAKEKLPGNVTLKDLNSLVAIILEGLEKEHKATLAIDAEKPPKDLYQLMRDPKILKAAKDLNVLTGLAEFDVKKEDET